MKVVYGLLNYCIVLICLVAFTIDSKPSYLYNYYY